MLRRITRNVEDAEDLAQEAFLRAFRALDRFDLERAFRPWLWTIGIRLALHALAKKEKRNLSLEDLSTGSEGDARGESRWLSDTGSLERLEGSLLRRDLEEALEKMDAQHRAILVLRIVEDHSYEEISRILGIPQGTVMSRLSRARARLKERMRAWGPLGDEDEQAV